MNTARPVSKGVVLSVLLAIGLLIAVAITWKPLREATSYRESIRVMFRELDHLQSERHRIAGLAPPKDLYSSIWTQYELETLEARQNAIGNAIAQRIQSKSLNSEALAALQYTEKKINDLRMDFERRRTERFERFAAARVQKGCHWIHCPEPFTLPGEAVLLKMRAENPDFGKTYAKPSKINKR